MEDIRIARSQTRRSSGYSVTPGNTDYTFRPWQNRVRVVVSGSASIVSAALNDYAIPPIATVSLDPAFADATKILVAQSLFTPLVFDIERYGSLVQGGFYVRVTQVAEPGGAAIVEMEITLPPGEGQSFAGQ